MPPSSTDWAGGVALGRAQAGRGRGRHRQQRRAAARGVFSPYPAPHERLWRIVAAPDARRCAALSGLQANDGGAARRQGGGQQHGAAKGDRRNPLSRDSRDRRRMYRLPDGPRRDGHAFRRAVRDRAVAGDHRRRDEERALRHRGGLSRRARRGAQTGIRDDRQRTDFCCSSIAPIWRSSATSLTRTGRSAISSALSSGSSRRSTRRWRTSRATAFGCMSAGAITKAPRLRRAARRHFAGHRTGQCRRLLLPLRQSAARP